MVAPEIIDLCIQEFQRDNYAYISNVVPPPRTFPRGLDVEVFSFVALEKAYREATENYEKEHVTPYIWENKNKEFKIGPTVRATNGYAGAFRLTLDYPEDFELIQKIYKEVYRGGRILDIREVIQFLDTHPKIAAINESCEQKKLKQ